MNNETYDTIILGAGLTGLTIAHYLRKSGRRVLVLEKGERPGGVIQTCSENGFVFEAGPNTGVISSVELVRLMDELGLQFEVPHQFANARWIWKKRRWEPLPSGLLSAIRTPLFTLTDKFRILLEPFRAKGTNPDETLAQLVVRRMGRSFLNYAVDPFISGIYAGDPAQLVTRYAMPKLYALEQNYGSFIKGSIAKARRPKPAEEKRVTRQVFSVEGGLSRLTGALVASVGAENIRCNCGKVQVEEVETGRYRIHLSESDSRQTARPDDSAGTAGYALLTRTLVTTFGGPSLLDTLPFIKEVEKENLGALRYAKVVQVAAGYSKWDGVPVRAFGGLVPTCERKDILGILFPSALFAHRAPGDGALMSVFMGGIKRPDIFELSDEQLKAVAVQHIREMMQARRDPDLLRVYRYPQAIPQYDATSSRRLKTITDLQFRYPGLLLAGNIRDGIGMSDRVKQGAAVARQIGEYLEVTV
jgi:oxygen-dependent protoporphyrinogen oxidase